MRPGRREAGLEFVEVGEPVGLERPIDGVGEIGLAVLLMGERQEGDREPAGAALVLLLQSLLEAAPVWLAREQRVAVDEVQERHGLLLQRVDDMAVVDDVDVGASGAGAAG